MKKTKKPQNLILKLLKELKINKEGFGSVGKPIKKPLKYK